MREGSVTPIASRLALRRARRSRETSSRALLRVLTTTRITTADSEIDSMPQSSGFSTMRERHFGVDASSVAVASMRSCTACTSVS